MHKYTTPCDDYERTLNYAGRLGRAKGLLGMVLEHGLGPISKRLNEDFLSKEGEAAQPASTVRLSPVTDPLAGGAADGDGT